MSKSKRLVVPKTIATVSTKCKDRTLVDTLIAKYQSSTKSAVESILAMSETVSELNKKYRDQLINSSDLDYFCLSVQLNRKGSQFRKFVCIGDHAAKFREYVETMPQAISVLYELTTLNPETFELLIEQEKIKPNLTLNQLKGLVHKTKKVIVKNNFDALTLNFVLDDVSESTKQLLSEFYAKLKLCKDISFTLPNNDEFSEFLENPESANNVIDVDCTEIQSVAVAA
jgi:hydroxymethylpyrimidine/phosphomethylpyrimidine kinase